MKKQKYRKPERILKSENIRSTPARLAIIKVLCRAKKPLSHKQIASAVRRKNLNRVTIYRTLELFIRAGIVHKACTHEKAWQFELSHHCPGKKCHPHLTCNSCGRTICLTEFSLPMVKGIPKGFVIRRQQVRLEGLCPRCA